MVLKTDVHVSIENLSLRYREKGVLHHISAGIPRHRVTAVIGPSGCGKTSLLRCINRLIDLVPGATVDGRVNLDGVDIYGRNVDVTEIRKRMGLIAQKPVLLPMSIFENVAYGPRIFGTGGKKKLHETVERALTAVGLWNEVSNRLKEPATRLSIGQQQRLCLARGLAVEPEVLLFDEPTSALDPRSAIVIEDEISRLKEEYTCVVVTHNLRQATRIADYVLFISEGILVESGSALDVLQSPKEVETQAYLCNEV
jgi:phosphate transport system ATP-binding protein